MNKKIHPGIGVGSASILVIFVLLCLVTFATLSLTSANADYRLTLKIAERTSSYYDACNEAEELLAELDGIFIDAKKNASVSAEYYEEITRRAADYEQVTLQPDGSQYQLTFFLPVNTNQQLHVVLDLLQPFGPDASDTDAPLYSIHTWQVENIGTWDGTEHFKLL